MDRDSKIRKILLNREENKILKRDRASRTEQSQTWRWRGMALAGMREDLGGHFRSFDSHLGTCSRMRSPSLLSVLPMYRHPQAHTKEYITRCFCSSERLSLGEATGMRRVWKITIGRAAGKIERHWRKERRTKEAALSPIKGTLKKKQASSRAQMPWDHVLWWSCNGQERREGSHFPTKIGVQSITRLLNIRVNKFWQSDEQET